MILLIGVLLAVGAVWMMDHLAAVALLGLLLVYIVRSKNT